MWDRLYVRLLEERGFILFPTLVLVILVFTIGWAILELTATEGRISYNQSEAAKALYLAEAGIQMAIHQLEAEPGWRAGYRQHPLGEGVIKEVTVDQQAQSVTIESQGEVNGIGRRIRVTLKKIPVPCAYPLVTNHLAVSPGAKLLIAGQALHYGDLVLTWPAELDGLFMVDGTVTLDKAVVNGAIYATGSMTVGDQIQGQARLVSAREVDCPERQTGPMEIYSGIPLLMPKAATGVDFSWYGQQPHLLLEEPVWPAEELWSGIFWAAGDLTLVAGSGSGMYRGQTAIVVPGTVTISCDLVAAEPGLDALFIVADRIVVEGQVRELWAALLAAESIQLKAGAARKEIHGFLNAPAVFIPPGITELQYCSLPGTHLVKEPQVLFQLTDWLEITLR